MNKLTSILTITAAALMFSSCIIVGPDRDADIIIEKRTDTTTSSTTTTTTTTPATITTTPAPASTYCIICKNETSYTITDWCVKKDNIVTYANSGFNRSIRSGGEDMIMDLPVGYYKVYFSFEDGYLLPVRTPGYNFMPLCRRYRKRKTTALSFRFRRNRNWSG